MDPLNVDLLPSSRNTALFPAPNTCEYTCAASEPLLFAPLCSVVAAATLSSPHRGAAGRTGGSTDPRGGRSA